MPERLADWRRQMVMLNPAFEHLLWDEQSLKAAGFDYYEASNKWPTPAGVSNAARLYVLRNYGGLYFDSDFIPLKPLDMFLDMGTAVAAEQADGRICNAFMGCTKGHPWVKWQYDRVSQYEKIAPFWGVDLASQAPRDGLTVAPRRLVYPFLWTDESDKRIPHEDTIMLHMWEGSWLP